MKIGIFTYHIVDNYGAVLQAYCLQEYLRMQGYDVYIVNYTPDYLIKPYMVFSYSSQLGDSILLKAKSFIRACIVAPMRWIKKVKFQNFRHKYLRLANCDLSNSQCDFDVFIFGSDQIWNSVISQGVDRIYFGRFKAACNKIILSYSASVGSVFNIDARTFSLMRLYLKNFNAISVREETLANYIKEKFKLNVNVVCDPVFLNDISLLDNIAIKPKENNPYLLLFLMSYDAESILFAKKTSKKMGLKLVNLATYESLLNYQKQKFVSPEMFIGYIKYASFIITTSFHGTAFSVLYKKNFYTLYRNENSNERAFSLLRSLGLEDRMVEIHNCTEVSAVDYSAHVINKLDEIVLNSKQFLKTNLEN